MGLSKFKRCLHILVALAVLTGSMIPLDSASVSTAGSTPNPETVTIAGTMQSELGCEADWMPSCSKTFLTYNAEDDVWEGTFPVTPNNDQDKKGPRYKAALNESWGENYGKNAAAGGADIPLLVTQATQVKFFYDHKTHWVTDNFNSRIVVAMGDFQTQLGCKQDNEAGCLRSWLEDPDGSGTYSFSTRLLKKGTYSATLVFNEDPKNTLGEPQTFSVAADGDEIYFGYDPVNNELTLSTAGAPKGSLAKLKAIWVNQGTLMWNTVGSPIYRYSLYYSPDARLSLTASGVQGGKEIPLIYSQSGPGGDVFTRNPYLAGYTALKIDPANFNQIPQAVQSQLAVVVRDGQGKVVDATGVQIPGVLDALYPYSGPLGVTFEGSLPTLRLWAPTARTVRLRLFSDASISSDQVFQMFRDDQTGVWSVTGSPDWKNMFYLYEVEVYVPSTGKFQDNLVTDPYSLSLSTNSQRSQVVVLNDASLKPQGWDILEKPALAAPEDIVIYELHIRDFSISDLTVPAILRGTYAAFMDKDSNGMQHLAALAKAGLTHIHLLPAFDIASVNEDKSTWQSVDAAALATLPPNSDKQAAAVNAIKDQDGFNWGYDPWHYTVPEGSYATDPNGTPRLLEFRQMVQALNQTGLRVIMDVVYNHTTASGQDPHSVLDKIVPGYYYRLDAEGKVETSTCCQDTASEHTMMQKLMIDSVVTWARQYKVDGFRFDLMGFHMLADMQAIRSALDGLTPTKDGVDGKSIYIYGEGWDFGEVANNARGVNATQLNIGGTGIGVFNDRLRDGARGGNPFSDPREQGFATGLLLQPNAAESRPAGTQKAKLLEYTDWIRLGLAGNLRDYKLVRSNGDTVDGASLLYNGAAAGYTLDPQENVIYVSAHDNETIFDAVQRKASADATLADRIRMNNLALSIPMLSQGVPFFHAGDDILRSKSLDGNSYNSGDWFNKLDWTLSSNNWGGGLPVEGSNFWNIDSPLLANSALKPAQADIQAASAVFQEYLQIRKSSPLFRLQNASQVERTVSFLNTGPNQVPGLIVMHLTDVDNLDPNYSDVLVFFNASPAELKFIDALLAGQAYSLHPVQQSSADPVVRTAAFESSSSTFRIPGRTTAVFVLKKTPPSAASVPTTTALATVLPAVTATTVVQATSVPAPELHGFSTPLVIGFLVLLALVIAIGFLLLRRRAK
jgi:pullulanase